MRDNQLSLAERDPDVSLLELGKAIGLDDADSTLTMLGQGIKAISKLAPEDRPAVNSLMSNLKAIAPRDPIEAMLALQMIACHTHAMRLMAKSLDSFSPELSGSYLSLSRKLMKTYTEQVQMLAKYRRGGEQTVRVEHVTIQGGQAIIGNVTGGGHEKS